MTVEIGELTARLITPEYQRLQLAVVSAAVAERLAAKEYEAHLISKNWHRSVETRVAREKAVDSLIAFEAENKIGVE